jgi:hypothetical protein
MDVAKKWHTWRNALAQWSPRRWWAALAFGLGIALIIALPTAVIPNPIFGRAIEVTWWSYPTVILSGILGGLLMASYVREPSSSSSPTNIDSDSEQVNATDELKDPALRWGTIGGFASFFAVGCPVCNKLILIALGTTGAVNWFAPIQPFLALASILFMVWALDMRLKNQDSCSLTKV